MPEVGVPSCTASWQWHHACISINLVVHMVGLRCCREVNGAGAAISLLILVTTVRSNAPAARGKLAAVDGALACICTAARRRGWSLGKIIAVCLVGYYHCCIYTSAVKQILLCIFTACVYVERGREFRSRLPRYPYVSATRDRVLAYVPIRRKLKSGHR